MAKLIKKPNGGLVLDVTGYVCPYPVIYTRKALAMLPSGKILEVITDNPPSCENVPLAAKEDGHEVISIDKVEEGVWRIIIIKKGG